MARGPIPDKPRDRPTVPQVLPLVEAFYATEGNEAGGYLHVILDDGNLEDDFIDHCEGEAWAAEDYEAAYLARCLLAMTRTQRRKVYAMFWARPRGRLLFQSAIIIKGIDLTPGL